MSTVAWKFSNNLSLSTKRILCYDSEFIREHTYYPQLALLQLWQPDWTSVRIYDPLNTPLTEIWQRIVTHDAPIILHAGQQDLELMYNACQKLPLQIRDTQVGFALCHPNKSIGLADMVAHYLNIRIDKSATRSDWLSRPLNINQTNYAAADAAFLGQIYPLLCADLTRLHRLTWWQEECTRLLHAMENPRSNWHWFRLSGAPHNLRKSDIIYAEALVNIREKIAESHNLPRQKILSDAALIKIAKHHPQDSLALADALPSTHILLTDIVLVDSLLAYYQNPQNPPPSAQYTRHPITNAKQFNRVMHFVKTVAQSLNIHADTLATSSQIRHWLAQPDDASALLNQGWRREIFCHFQM